MAPAGKKKSERTSGERRSPRQGRAQATVETILAAAARMLAAHGFSAINTHLIAEAADISVGSLYQYFKNKDEVLLALIEQQSALVTEVIQTKLVSLARQPLPVIVQGMVEAFLDGQRVGRGFFRILRQQVPRTSQFSRIDQVQKDLIALLTGALSSKGAGLSVDDPAMAAFIIVHAIDGITDAALRGDVIGTNYAALVEETTKLVINYLMVHPAVAQDAQKLG